MRGATLLTAVRESFEAAAIASERQQGPRATLRVHLESARSGLHGLNSGKLALQRRGEIDRRPTDQD